MIYTWDGTEKAVSSNFQTKLLTIWRTLWVELDSMNDPVVSAPLGPDDPDPGDLPNAPIDLLAANFLPANIEVIQLPEGTFRDAKDDLFFHRYLVDADATLKAPALSVRDYVTAYDVWVVHIINSYNHSDGRDFDVDETDVIYGISVHNTNVAYIFAEAIRDRSAFAGSAAYPATVDEARLLQRAVLHESGHLMGVNHVSTPAFDLGVMNVTVGQFGSDTDAVFTEEHFGIFQAKAYPEAKP